DNLFTWPQYDDQSTSLIQAVESLAKNMPLCEFKSCSSVDNTFPVDNHTKVHLTDGIINCTHHFYASKKMDFNNETCFFERIVIPYGPVVFEAFQIRIAPSSPLPPYPSSYSYINNLIPDPVIAWPKELETQPLTQSSLPYFLRPSHSSNTTSHHNLDFMQEDRTNKSPSLPFITSSTSQPSSSSVSSSSSGPPPSLFQKFRLHQTEKTKSIEKKRRLVEQHTLQHSMSRISDMIPNKFNKASEAVNTIKICARCHTNSSPEWRRGPDGNKTLCNACGLRN
ncbi:blue light receptor, partial [Rhizopus stolonifer]